ncbi:MAG: hypothetical protein LBC71_05480 [Oscillospiraceae bacterium]|nr:hypothetical protein [Oscillospiraceae bacterium]
MFLHGFVQSSKPCIFCLCVLLLLWLLPVAPVL